MLATISFLASLLLLASGSRANEYNEELILQNLGDGAVAAHFEFTSTTPLHAAHVDSFPPALADLLQQYGVQQLELALTQGRWVWPQQPMAAAAGTKPTGLELKVAFASNNSSSSQGSKPLPPALERQAAYAALAQALGGLLCAGVAMVPQLAVMAAPAVGWFPHQQPTAVSGSERQVYAWLPQEAVCTENLAAWRRLLPCRHHAGLAALLQPAQLAAAPYYSLGLQLWVAEGTDAGPSSKASNRGSQQQQVHLREVLTAVLPSGTIEQQQQQQQHQGLLEALFHASSFPRPCPAAASSRVYLAGLSAASPTDARDGRPSGCREESTPAGPLLVCDATQLLPAGLLGSSSSSNSGNSSGGSSSRAGAELGQPQAPLPLLQVAQHVVQHSSRAGTLAVAVRVAALPPQQQLGGSGSGESDMLLQIMQLMPWQLLVDAFSLQLVLNGQALHASSPELVWQEIETSPDRTAVIELLLRLPTAAATSSKASGSSSSAGGSQQPAGWYELTMSISYQAAFVGVFDHAPDASRGVDVPPAMATLVQPCTEVSLAGSSSETAAHAAAHSPPLLRRLQAECGAAVQQRYSGGGSVVPLPIPDFSMPFNVICFTSTLLAILLGGVANVVLRSPEELAGKGVAEAAGGTPVWKRKLRRVAALLVLMGILAVYLDRDLQRQAQAFFHHFHFLVGRTQAPEQHGEL